MKMTKMKILTLLALTFSLHFGPQAMAQSRQDSTTVSAINLRAIARTIIIASLKNCVLPADYVKQKALIQTADHPALAAFLMKDLDARSCENVSAEAAALGLTPYEIKAAIYSRYSKGSEKALSDDHEGGAHTGYRSSMGPNNDY